MDNAGLTSAKKAKKDEFYTRWADIEREMNAYLEFDPDVFRGKTVLMPCDDPEWSNFTKFFALHFREFGLKKLISTSFAANSKSHEIPFEPTLFEIESADYDVEKTRANGKKFVLVDADLNGDGVVNIEDLQWEYLEGDGDFQSAEVTALRDEADIIVTNPPFSLLQDFVLWILAGGKKFSIVGHQNAITYKGIFPLIRDNLVWLGKGFPRNMAHFDAPYTASKWVEEDDGSVRVSGVQWFTNIDHGRRHAPMQLMTEADNIKYSRHKEVQGIGYRRYDNFNAIEIPYSDAIPSDYLGIMGVPITFLNKHNPSQFQIVGCSYDYGRPEGWDPSINMSVSVDGANIYKRLLIQHKKGA